jgi:hypothetical protein
VLTLQVIGALCIVIALIGGGLKISSIEIPKLSTTQIIALLAAGILFIAAGLLVSGNSTAGPSQGPGSGARFTTGSQP